MSRKRSGSRCCPLAYPTRTEGAPDPSWPLPLGSGTCSPWEGSFKRAPLPEKLYGRRGRGQCWEIRKLAPF